MKWLSGMVAVFALAACGEAAGPFTLVCEAYYRADDTKALSPAKVLRAKVVIPRGPVPEIARPPKVAEAKFEELTLRLADHRNGSVIVDVLDSRTGKQISRHLWQFSKPPGNPFGGTGQGFTGLIYVKHPATGAELQFFCKAGRGGKGQ